MSKAFCQVTRGLSYAVKRFVSLRQQTPSKKVNSSILPTFGCSRTICYSWNSVTAHADRLTKGRQLLKPEVFDLLPKLSSNKGHFAPTCKLRPLLGSDRCILRVLKGTFQSSNGSGSCSL